jgi:hypothetical protein
MADGAGGINDTFRYKVELDTQGLASQLASVRDTVSQGLGQAGRAVVGGGELLGGAANRLSSDLMMGQQALSGAFSAQMAMPSMGVASTTLAGVPGMPQTFGQEMSAVMGLSRAPVGIFPSQFQAVAMQRLNERAQNAASGAITGVASVGFGLVGAGIGSLAGPIGTVVGGLAGSLLGDTLLAPVTEAAQQRMQGRAQIQQIFGWNTFNDEQRSAMSGFMAQRSVKSLFSPEEFNSVLPAAVKGGFMKGVGRGDVAGFQKQLGIAEQAIQESMFTMQLTGAEGVQAAGELFRGFRRLGAADPAVAGRMMRESRVLAQQMTELGEFIDPMEVDRMKMEMGAIGAQMGVSPQAMMDTFSTQAATVNAQMKAGTLNSEDIALLGGSPTEAATRLTTTLAATQRQPIFKAMALAFGQVDPLTGKAGISAASLEQMGSGRMSFGAMAERMSQQLGTGSGGTTKMLTLMANQGKLQGDMMQQQGQMLRGMTDDILKQANMEATDGTRQFIMQRVFGVGEAESRALVSGAPMESAERKRLEVEGQKVDQEVKSAITTAQTGVAREFDVFVRGIKDALGKPLDDISHAISNKLAPPLQSSMEHLSNIEQRLGATGMRSNSPISVGPIDFRGNDGSWMHPSDPGMTQGFRAVSDSRRYPVAMVSMQAQRLQQDLVSKMTSAHRETMAG